MLYLELFCKYNTLIKILDYSAIKKLCRLSGTAKTASENRSPFMWCNGGANGIKENLISLIYKELRLVLSNPGEIYPKRSQLCCLSIL